MSSGCHRVHGYEKRPSRVVGSSGAGCRRVCYARRLPPRSWRQAHQVGVEELIAGQGRRACFNAQADGAPELLRRCSTLRALRARGGAGARLARGGLGVRRGDLRHARHVVRARARRATARRRSRSSATSTRSGSRSRTSRRTACSRSPRSAASRRRRCIGQRFELLTANGRIPAAIARKRMQPEQVRDRAAARAHRPAHRHRRDEPRGGRAPRPRRRRRRVGRRAGRAAERAPACRRRSTTGSARTSRSRRRGASREAGDAQVDVVAVAAVQEEIGSYGARAAGVRARARRRDRDRRHAGDGRTRAATPRTAGAIELGMGAMIARGPTLNKRRHRSARRRPPRRRASRTRSRCTRATTSTDADEIHLARAGVPTGLVSIPTRYVHSPNELCALADVEAIIALIVAFAGRLPRDAPSCAEPAPAGSSHFRRFRDVSYRCRHGVRHRRLEQRKRGRERSSHSNRCLTRTGIRPWLRERDRQRGSDAVRQARRRARRLRGDRARRDRDPGSARADRRRAARAAVRDHGPGAAGRRRPGARAPGGDRRRAAEGDAGRHDQQGLRVVDPRDRDRRLDDPRRRRRRRRHRRDGVDVERAVPPQEGALRLPPRERRADRLDGLRRPHVDLRRAAHGRAELEGRARARDLARGAGRMGRALAGARGGRAGRGPVRRRDRRRSAT